MQDAGCVRPSGGIHDDTREVVCDVVIDGRHWRGKGTLIERVQGPVAVLELTSLSGRPVVIDDEPGRII